MDCRTAHTLMAHDEPLGPDEQRALEAHLAHCPACHDDFADPMGRALAQTTIELALPPPDFTAKLLQRLPKESPLELARQAERQQRQRQKKWVGGIVVVVAASIALGLGLQSFWSDTALGLAARGILDIVAVFAVPFLGIVVCAALVAFLLQRALRQPTVSFTLGAAALACGLVVASGALFRSLDHSATSPTVQNAAVVTLTEPVRATGDIRGDVVSLWGDIVVDGQVSGNVVSILGDVTLNQGARVAGDVLAGSGEITTSQADQIAGVERRGVPGTPLRAVGESAEQLSPSLVRGLTGLLGALITLALAGILVLLWPQRTLQTSRILPTRPWLALGIGVLITALLALLTLPVLALLALTVVGLLLVPLLLLVVHLPYVQGLAAVGQALGQRLTGSATIGSALWGVAAQLVVVIGIGLIAPPVGLLIFYLLASLGLGAQLIERQTNWAV
ncbi:MAG TPA: zf-HC2 domain-containing protein [Herpetosiphonaceae bacterium]